MRVLLTRPLADSKELADVLARRGIDSLIEPLLAIDYLDPPLELSGVQALAVTSANGARALARVWPRHAERPPVFAVGRSSAAAATAAGFTQVTAGEGDVEALARLIAARLDPGQGAVLHASGSEAAGDLCGQLRRLGFTTRRAVLYRAAPANNLSAGVRAALCGGSLDGVLLYSPRTAEIFARLIRAAELAESCRVLRAYCLSPNVAAAAELPFREVLIAAQPSETALLELLSTPR